jgi:hypothetical protein
MDSACAVLAPLNPEDTNLVRLIAAWPQLPAHINAAVLALLDSAGL